MKVIDLKDRFARSLVAGFLASVILLALNLFSYYVLHFTNRRYINYSALMIFGRKSETFAEAVISSIAQVGFATGLIVFFSYLILKKNSNNYLWRGWFIGLGSWFGIMSISYIVGIQNILPINVGSAVSFMITSSVWGIFGAWFLKQLDVRYNDETEKQTEDSIRKFYTGKDEIGEEKPKGSIPRAGVAPNPARKQTLTKLKHIKLSKKLR